MIRKVFAFFRWAFWPAYGLVLTLIGWSRLTENWEWAVVIALAGAVVFVMLLVILRQIDIYNDTKAILGCYKKTEDVTPDDFLITKFNENYLQRKSDELIQEKLKEGEYVLVKGIPRIGKTRAVYEMVKKLKDYYMIMIPTLGRVEISLRDAQKIKLPLGRNRIVLVFDDLDKYVVRKELIHFDAVIDHLKRKSKAFKLIATCRGGGEHKHVEDAKRHLKFCNRLEIVELQRLMDEEAIKLGELIGKDVKRIRHDGTPGGIVIDLGEMKNKYIEGREKGYHLVLHALRLLREAQIYAVESGFLREIVARIFKVEEKTDWHSALRWNLQNGFVERLDKWITPGHDSYLDDEFLEDFESDEIDMNLERLVEIVRDLQHVDAMVRLGYNLIIREMFDPAIRCLRSLIDIKPDSAIGHTGLGIAYGAKDLPEEAVSEFKRALTINPDFPGARGGLALTYLRKGLVDEAITELEEVLRTDPDLPDAHSMLGSAYLARDRLDDAIRVLEEGSKINPHEVSLHRKLAIAYSKKHLWDDAIRESQKALEKNGDDADARYHLGFAFFEKRLYDDAIRELKEAVRIDPHNASAVGNLACAYEMNKDKQAALGQWKRYLELAENDPKHEQLVPKAKERIRELEGG